jgi:hypothetical protein
MSEMRRQAIGRRNRGVLAAAALLTAMPIAGLAVSASAAASPFYVSFAGSGGELYQLSTTGVPGGTVADLGFPVIAGTSPALAPVGVYPFEGDHVDYQVAAISTYNMLYLDPWPPANEGDGALGVVYNDTTVPAASGTSPAVTYNLADSSFSLESPYATAYYVAAINSGQSFNFNHLLLVPNDPLMSGQEVIFDTGLLMAPHASPAVASDSNVDPNTDFIVSAGAAAFQGHNGDLWTDNWGSGISPATSGFDTGVAVVPDTNASITAYNYDTVQTGFATAINYANNGDALVVFQVYNNAGPFGFTVDTGLKMASDASPAIAYDGTTSLFDTSRSNGAHVEVAFRGTDGNLITWVGGTGAHTDTGLGISQGTNPAISYVNGGYEIAFHGTNGHLWLYNSSSGGTDTGLAMAPGSSPGL